MTVVDGRWPFAGRDTDVARIRAVLGEEPARGVVLVGPSGIGKTMIAQQVVGGLARNVDTIYLRGSAAHATTPYGALNVLLAELDEDTARNPLLVLSALQRMFEEHPAHRRTLMHIDGVEEIDELSATVIAHLARVGAVRLLVTCEDLLRAPAELFDLWKDEFLERFDIQPLTLDDATGMLTTALGAPVSRSAAQELWASSGGNPKYLQIATKTDVASGHLLQCDGVWVSRDVPRPDSGRSLTDWAAANLAALPAEDRVIVEVLAAAGRVPLTVLLSAVSATSLDALQSDGVVTLDREGVPLARLTHEVFADVVRAQLLSAGGRAALRSVSTLRNDPGMPVQARLALAAWALEEGDSFDAAELVVLARLANDAGIDGAAERFLDALPPSQVDCTALLERTRQLSMDGRVAEALVTVENALASGLSEAAPLEDWVDARLLAARLRARTNGREKDSGELLDAVAARLAAEPASEATADLTGKAEMARMQVHVFEGELDRVCASAPAVLARGGDSTRWSTGIRSLLSFAQAVMGSQEQAVAAARNVDARAASAPSAPFERELTSTHLYTVLLLAGYWTECLDRAGADGDLPPVLPAGGSRSEFAEGVLLAYLGRSSEALEKLLPAISQFRTRDRHGFLPLAEAAAAYAQVLENAPDAAEDHLRAIDLSGQRYPWHLREAVQYFRLLAEAWLGTPDVVATEFLEHALVLGSRGYHGVELFFLNQAVQLGQHEAADLLATSAAAADGPYARLSRDFAQGLVAQDPGGLKELARRALDSGNYNLAGDIAALSIEHLTETDDPMIRVHAEQILRKTSTPARRHVRRRVLSERERAIARMVAQGVPNKEIAQQEHISPRTVEGHVHQVMSKLGLSTRKQLALIFGQQQ